MSESLIRRIKRHLPASSVSFHSAHEEDIEHYWHLTEAIDRQGEALSDARKEIEELREQCCDLRQTLEYEHESAMVMYWQMFRREGETLEETQLRFFRGLPHADGIHRLFQDAEAKLLLLFDHICSREGIQYWGTGGTVLGAYRQEDFIPWDDDVDIYMTRDQLRKLEEAVTQDGRFRITVVWDWFVPCKQIRFRPSDPDNPCFVDLFPLDWVGSDPMEAWQACSRERVAFVQRIRDKYRDSNWSQVIYIDESDPLTVDLERDLQEALNDLTGRIRILPSEQGADGLIRGIENIDEVHPSGPYLLSDWTEPVRLPFRKIRVPVPRNYKEYLARAYGDYMSLPRDMHTHEHVTDEYISSPESVNAMHRLLEGES